MCGICAGIGSENQIEKVVGGLKKLEYRGYDSCGLAYIKATKNIEFVKCVGGTKNLENRIDKTDFSNVVIGHTRWATHGTVNEENAHPHMSFDGQFAIVHNGIVENFEELKKQIDVQLKSQTDTEVLVNLICKQSGTTLEKICKACQRVVGSFAIALIEKGKDEIFFARRGSPLWIAADEKGVFAGSDISVFDKNFKKCFCLEDDEFAVATSKKVEFFDKNCKKIEKEPISVENVDFFDGFSDEQTFMLKEIKEQPIVLRKTCFNLFSSLDDAKVCKLKKFKKFHFVACGTAYHSCLMGCQFIQKFCKKQCEASIASEFRYADNVLSKNCLYVFVSQSGETADTIASARLVKDAGFSVMCVTNVPYCTLNSLADFVLPTYAGKEMAVASTKAYTAQVFSLLIFALRLGGETIQNTLKDFVQAFDCEFDVDKLCQLVLASQKVFFIGRGQDYVSSLEAALKLKEIAYINCLGMPAGELKHGTLALVDENSLVVAISTQEKTKKKIESNILEVQARGGKVTLISNLEHNIDVDLKLTLPNFEEFLMPIVSIVPLQLLAFEVCQRLGFDPDKPRNLAKSVTVE